MDIHTILHPTDGSADARKALDLACDLALARGASLILLHVQRRHGLDLSSAEMQRFERVEHLRVTDADIRRAAAQGVLDAAEQEARGRGVPKVETVLAEGDPSRVIVETAKSKGVDMIVMGTRGLGDLEGLFLGSVSHKVAHAASCSCLIVR